MWELILSLGSARDLANSELAELALFRTVFGPKIANFDDF
jgi:hypothetical protein